jgi:uncharacterized membrane protein
MGPLKILLVILSFWVVAALVFLAGSFLADYVVDHAARLHHGGPADAAALIVPMYFFTRFIICPIVSIAVGAFAAWKIAKSDLTF